LTTTQSTADVDAIDRAGSPEPSPRKDGPSDGDHATRPQAKCKMPIWPGVSPPGKALRQQQPEGGASMQAAAQNAEGIRVLVLLAAIAIIAFWRTAIRLVFILVVTAIIAAIGYGAIAIYQTMHTM
jgi:hypothetical protein